MTRLYRLMLATAAVFGVTSGARATVPRAERSRVSASRHHPDAPTS